MVLKNGERVPGLGGVKALRVARGWSLRDLARETGLGLGTVNAAERGRNATLTTLYELARVFDTTPGALIDGEADV